jgi:hypothetical protein
VPEMLQEKLHRVAVSNVDAEVKVGWLKLWNGNRFDKDTLHFPKSPLSDSALDDWLSKSIYWAQLKKKTIKELESIFSSPLQLLAYVPTLSEYIQPGSLRLSIQYSIVNSKAEMLINTTVGMSNLILILL